MSDVKRFTGFIAVDNTTHKSEKEAVEHSRAVKTKTALEKLAGDLQVRSHSGDLEQLLSPYLYENRVAILAALNQEVLTRKKRTVKPKVPSVNPAA